MNNRSDIVDVLINEKHLDVSEKEKMLSVLSEKSALTPPWYIQLITGGSAWLASLCFMISLAFLGLVESDESLSIVGGIFIITTLLLSQLKYRSGSLFIEQVLLAVSLTGHGYFIAGMAGLYDQQKIVIAITMISLSIINILFYKSLIHKLFATWVLLIGSAMLMYEFGVPKMALFVMLLLIPAAITAWMWMNESLFLVGKRAAIGRPVLYALTICILFGARISEELAWIVKDFLNKPDVEAGISPDLYIKALGVGYFIIFIYVIAAILKRLRVRLITPLGIGLILMAGFICAVFYQSSSILSAVILLLIGIERGNKILVPVAVISLVAFYSQYYYSLDMTLMKKSMTLSASGLVMLIGGWLVGRMGVQK